MSAAASPVNLVTPAPLHHVVMEVEIDVRNKTNA